METLSHRACVAVRIPLGGYSSCSEVQVVCCTAVLSILQLSYLGFGRDGSMRVPEDVEVTVTKSFCIRLAIAMDIIRVDLVCAR